MHWIAACLIVWAQLAVAAGVGSDLRINVRLVDYADVPKATLMKAERQVTGIFHDADVATEWLNCKPISGQPPCVWIPTGPVLLIQVLPEEMIRHVGLGRLALACSIVPVESSSEEEFSTDAYVCFPRVSAMAISNAPYRERNDWTSAILGSVMAHELGHLLGIRAHQMFGLMYTPWSLQEVNLARQGRLLFTSEEKRKIQAHLHRRMIAAGYSSLGTDAALVNPKAGNQETRDGDLKSRLPTPTTR